MKKSLFKKIIIFYAALNLIYSFKLIFFHYIFAPSELAKAMKLFDEMQPLPDNVTFMFMFIILILTILSIVKLYQFKNIGRVLFLISIAGTIIVSFSSSYYVYDVIEIIMEIIYNITTGLIIGVIYFSNLKNSFE